MSGVIWIKTPENSGQFQFDSPHIFAESYIVECTPEEIRKEYNYYTSFRFTPKEGRMILFPSHMEHQVLPSESDEDRISIAFNLEGVS